METTRKKGSSLDSIIEHTYIIISVYKILCSLQIHMVISFKYIFKFKGGGRILPRRGEGPPSPQVTDLSQQIHDGCLFSNACIPSTIKSQAIRLLNTILRAEEEISRLNEEMLNCIEHFVRVYEYLIGKIDQLKTSNPDSNPCICGHVCLLKQSLKKYRVILSTLLPFAEHIDISLLENFLLHLDDDLEQVRDASISEEIPLHKEPFIPVEDRTMP